MTFGFGLALLATLTTAVTGSGHETRVEQSNPTVAVSSATFKGQPAVRALDVSGDRQLVPIVRLTGPQFRNGTIEAEVAGVPAEGAPEGSRGFIGIAFRIQPDATRYEAFYIRPTNGRADDQLRRNHSTQYVSAPDHPWHLLREKFPGVYESYADMVPGEWTRLKIEVDGAKARLYINGAEQPALIVNDLKLGADAAGGIGLWVGSGTEGYFRNVRVTPAVQ